MRSARCDQPPMQIVRLSRPIANLLCSWCDTTIDYIHNIKPLNEWLGSCRVQIAIKLILLCLLLYLVTCLLDRRRLTTTSLVMQAGHRGYLMRLLLRPL